MGASESTPKPIEIIEPPQTVFLTDPKTSQIIGAYNSQNGTIRQTSLPINPPDEGLPIANVNDDEQKQILSVSPRIRIYDLRSKIKSANPEHANTQLEWDPHGRTCVQQELLKEIRMQNRPLQRPNVGTKHQCERAGFLWDPVQEKCVEATIVNEIRLRGVTLRRPAIESSSPRKGMVSNPDKLPMDQLLQDHIKRLRSRVKAEEEDWDN